MSSMDSIIDRIVARLLEDWAMMLVDKTEMQLSELEEQECCFLGKVTFKGVVDGSFAVACSQSFLETVTTNLLGFDHPADKEQCLDTLRELTNVFSGNLLTNMYGDDTVFELVVPEAYEASFSEVAEVFRLPQRNYTYLGDGEPVAVTFWLKEEAHDCERVDC